MESGDKKGNERVGEGMNEGGRGREGLGVRQNVRDQFRNFNQ